MFENELRHLAEEIGQLLMAKKQVVTLAESCTGGLLSALITEVPGSSAWFDSGLVVYSNQAKQDLLKVKASTLDQFGAVSEEVAAEMAIGVLNQGRADIAISITGIAGPDGGTSEKPVGTVCFAWARKHFSTKTEKHLFQGNREEVRQQSVQTALLALKELLK